MSRSTTSTGLIAAVISAVSFGTSGAFVKPLLEAGWSPAAAVTARALTAGVVLLPFVLVALRGRWSALWRGRWRVLAMGLVGVAFTQAAYFAAIRRIPVSTALLVEYLAPLLLVGFAWATTRRTPRPMVLLGSVLAVGGLVLVIGPGALQAVDPIGLGLAFSAAVGCALYFAIAARPAEPGCASRDRHRSRAILQLLRRSAPAPHGIDRGHALLMPPRASAASRPSLREIRAAAR